MLKSENQRSTYHIFPRLEKRDVFEKLAGVLSLSCLCFPKAPLPSTVEGIYILFSRKKEGRVIRNQNQTHTLTFPYVVVLAP